MKKIFTFFLGLVAALIVQAQSDFPLQFADKDGNIIADGTVLNLTTAESDDFGDVLMSTNLFVKNTFSSVVKAITLQLAQKKYTKNEQPNKVAHFHYIKFRFKYCSIVSLMIVFIFFSCSVTIRPFSIASWTITSVSPFC